MPTALLYATTISELRYQLPACISPVKDCSCLIGMLCIQLQLTITLVYILRALTAVCPFLAQ